MSGGVDSSVAAALLKKNGYDVVGVTMCFNISHPNSRRPACCGIEGINDARRAAGILGIPHYVLNFGTQLTKSVVDNFVAEYAQGRTPNPCVRCNQLVKFDALFKKVRALGADYLATGHYARVKFNSIRRCYELKKARDGKKDQAYFLYGIPAAILPNILFPLGNFTKSEVRDLARKFKLNTAEKAESQDICFVSDRDYKKFIRERLGEQAAVPGKFKDPAGKVLGGHQGIINYTIGQRERLGLAMGYPVYVYRIDPETDTVYVGKEEFLYSRGLTAESVNWLLPQNQVSKNVSAQIRYNADPVSAKIRLLPGQRAEVIFKQPQKAVTPGQSVVFYSRDKVLGGGIISSAL